MFLFFKIKFLKTSYYKLTSQTDFLIQKKKKMQLGKKNKMKQTSFFFLKIVYFKIMSITNLVVSDRNYLPLIVRKKCKYSLQPQENI